MADADSPAETWRAISGVWEPTIRGANPRSRERLALATVRPARNKSSRRLVFPGKMEPTSSFFL